MLRIIGLTIAALALPLLASADDDEVLRLPGQGEVKPELKHVGGIGRLVPGGGLLLSFDTNEDGVVTSSEVETGIVAAFTLADANADGRVSPLEQISWSETLPTRDMSLANPARFDPNLDRVVREQEFTDIVQLLASVYADPTTGNIYIADLKAAEQRRQPPEETELAPDRRPPSADQPPGGSRQRSARS